MPNDKVLSRKKAIVAELAEKMKNATSGVLVDYKGITVEADTKLRREMREAGVDYSVVKNTMLRFAINEIGFEALDEHLSGTTALALGSDAVLPAKILAAYAKKNNKFQLKAGFVEGKVIDSTQVKALASLPSREELVAKVLGGFNAPLSGLVNVLNGNIRGLAVALGAIAEKRATQESA